MKKYLYVTHNCKLSTKNAKFAIIDQTYMFMPHVKCSPWKRTLTLVPLVRYTMFSPNNGNIHVLLLSSAT